LAPRCAYVADTCKQQRPGLTRTDIGAVRCFYPITSLETA
jgi:dipeptide transport system ATP-binding protein